MNDELATWRDKAIWTWALAMLTRDVRQGRKIRL